MTEKRLPALDGLRAVAVSLVIFGHAGYPIKGIPADTGVNLFFVLSGFLITRLLLREEEETGSVSLSRFYWRRTLRIFPAYYAFLAASFLLDYLAHSPWPTSLGLSGLTYTVNYYNALHGHPSTSIAHAWSLAVEEQFYLLWPLLFILLAKRRQLVAGLTVLLVAVVAYRTFQVFNGASTAYLYNAFETRFDSLAIGCLFAVISTRIQRWAPMVAPNFLAPLAVVVLILLSRFSGSDNYHYAFGFTVEALLCALLIFQCMYLAGQGRIRWLESRPMRYLGTISYPMYLYHAIGGSFGRRVPGTNVHLEFLGTFAATVIIASLSYYVIERPFLKLRNRVTTPARKPVPAV